MATLQQSMQSMKGVGEAQKYKLASFLERNQIRGAVHMDKILYGEEGFVTRAKALDDNLDDHGREMITKITDLFKDSIGKSASETRDILTKMKVIQKTLKGATDEQSSIIQELTKAGVAALQSQGSLFNVAKDVIGGRLRGFAGKQLMKIPGAGITSAIFSERKRRKGIAADAAAEFSGGDTGEEIVDKLDEIDENTEPKKEDKLGKRESMLESLRGKVGGFMGKLSGKNKEGGGLGGMLSSFLPKLMLIGPALLAFGGMLAAGASATIGFLMPIIGGLMAAAPFIAIAAGAAGLIMLAMNWDEVTGFLKDSLGISSDQDEALEKADESANKVLARNADQGPMRTKEGKGLYRNRDTDEIEQFSDEEMAAMDSTGDSVNFTPIKDVQRGGASLRFRQGEDADALRAGTLSFDEAKGAVGRSELNRKEKDYIELLSQVVSADKEFRSGYKRDILNSDNWESQFNTWGDRWAGVFKNIVFDIEMRERMGMITQTEADKLYTMSPFFERGWSADDYTFDQPWMLFETVGELNTPAGTFEGKNWDKEELDGLGSPWKSDPQAKSLFLHTGGLIKKRNVPAVLDRNEVVVPLSNAMVPQAGTLSEGAKLLIQTLMGNALFKGTEPMGGGAGGASNVIAPINNSVVSQTDNIFAGAPFTRNTEPSIRDMQRLLYA